MADTEQKPRSEAQIYISALEDAIEEIADLVGVPHALAQLDTVRRRVKDIRAERDTAEARVKELEAKHATEIKASSTVNTSLMRQISKAHEALDAAGIPRSAEEDGEPGSPWTLGQRIAVLLIPGDDESPAEWAIDELDKIVHGEPRPFACDLDKLINAVKVMKSDIATEKADPTRDYNAEIVAARIDALKTLGVNPYDPPVCIHGAAKKKAKTLEHAQKFEDELAQIWELWGAGREREPGKLHELCQEQERLSSALESKLRVITEKLDDTKVPSRYGRDQDGGAVDITERVDLLITYLDDERRSAAFWESSAQREAEERVSASEVLDELGAPDYAGRSILSTAARIRALPGLLRKD